MSRPAPPAPDYGAGVHRLVPAAVGAVTGASDGTLPLPGPVRAVCVMVVDGLGARLLDAHRDLAPTLAGAGGPVLHAPFPSTTATSLVGIGTGRPPGEHGITGYSFAVPGADRPLVALTWSWAVHDPALAVTDEVVPEDLQPLPTAFDAAREAGVRPVTVLRPAFVGSGLTRAGLRGGEVVPATGLEETLGAVEQALGGDEPTVVYAYHGDVDTIGHLTGPGSEEWCAELVRVDAAIAATRRRLPAHTALVVTADHGMVRVPDDGLVELVDHPRLLAGVRTLTGDARARQLHVEEGARDEVLAAWRRHCGDRADVLTRHEAIEAGWFGPRVVDHARAHIGDVIVSARAADVAWVHADADLFGGRLPGMHGALTPDELEVPAAVLTAG